MKKINKNKGILFWITGLSGSGKTTLGKAIHKDIKKLYGPTIMISGDDVRKIFDLKGYEYKQRLKITKKYCKFQNTLLIKKLILFLQLLVCHGPRRWNKKYSKLHRNICKKIYKIIKKNKKNL